MCTHRTIAFAELMLGTICGSTASSWSFFLGFVENDTECTTASAPLSLPARVGHRGKWSASETRASARFASVCGFKEAAAAIKLLWSVGDCLTFSPSVL